PWTNSEREMWVVYHRSVFGKGKLRVSLAGGPARAAELTEGEELLSSQAPDLGLVCLAGEIEHEIEELDGLLKIRHVVAQFSPNHAVGTEGVERPLHDRLRVWMRVGLL